jgi:transforming growth factor-beta-induced protein
MLNSAAGPITLFAPTDAAFQSISQDFLLDVVSNDDYILHLKTWVWYHVLQGKYRPTSSFTGNEDIGTLADEDITVTLDPLSINEVPVRGDSDNLASNGIVHILEEAVLAPTWLYTSIADWASELGEISIFASLLERSTVLSTLEGAFTLVAPSNEALSQLSAARLNFLKDPSNVAQLNIVISYHILSGIFTFDELFANGNREYTTRGGPISVAVEENEFVVFDNADIEYSDILASDGVLHMITDLLVPPSYSGP